MVGICFFFFQAEDGIRDYKVTGVQTCALPISKTEHLTTSARNLYVTQSTLSHGLRQLEEELGMALFERIGRGLKLSQAGVVFRNYAERALHEVEAGRMALAEIGRAHV